MHTLSSITWTLNSQVKHYPDDLLCSPLFLILKHDFLQNCPEINKHLKLCSLSVTEVGSSKTRRQVQRLFQKLSMALMKGNCALLNSIGNRLSWKPRSWKRGSWVTSCSWKWRKRSRELDVILVFCHLYWNDYERTSCIIYVRKRERMSEHHS